MPVYNRQAIVGDAIDSILNQSFQDWELVILDDASTDGSLEVCRSYAEKDARIHVISNDQNLGVGRSRNRLNQYATGKYIAIQDSDDVSLPQRLEREVEILEKNPDIGLVSGLTSFVDDAGKVVWTEPELLYKGAQYPQNLSEMTKLLYDDCVVANPAAMFRRSVLDHMKEPFGDYRIVDDWNFFLHVSHRHRIWGIHDVLVKMRRGKEHMHLWKDPRSGFKEAYQLKRRIYEYYKNDPNSPIDFSLYLKSMAPWLAKEGRYIGGLQGYAKMLLAVLYDPSCRRARESLWEYTGRAFRKVKRVAIGQT
jgi:glycosyltransferase involved in cell wall biosynthesis